MKMPSASINEIVITFSIDIDKNIQKGDTLYHGYMVNIYIVLHYKAIIGVHHFSSYHKTILYPVVL